MTRCIRIELIKKCHPHGKEGIGKELDGFGFCRAHKEYWDIFFERSLL